MSRTPRCRRHARLRAPILIPLLLVGCSDPVTVKDGNVEIFADSGAFTVRNRAPVDSLVVAIVERETAALIDLAPCDEWPDPIAPRGERRVPYEDVIGYEVGAADAFVYWCARFQGNVTDGGSLTVPFD
jgi:hypothetical protein